MRLLKAAAIPCCIASEETIRIAIGRTLGGKALEILMLDDNRGSFCASEGMMASLLSYNLNAIIEGAEGLALLRRGRNSSRHRVAATEYIGSRRGLDRGRRIIGSETPALRRPQQPGPGETFYLTLPISMT